MENDFGTDNNEELENMEDFGSELEGSEMEDMDMIEDQDDDMDEFEDSDSMDEEDMEKDDLASTLGDIADSITDLIDEIEGGDYDDEEDTGDYDEEDMEELDDSFEEVEDLDLEEGDEEEEVTESAQAAAKNDTDKTNHAETLDQAQKNAKGGALKQNGPSGKSESKPVEDLSAVLKNAAAHLDEISGRDIEYKGKHGTESQPAESQDQAMKNAKGHLEGEEHDDTVNSTKNDGKQTSTSLKGVTYESFMSDADRLFNEAFDNSFREAGKSKK